MKQPAGCTVQNYAQLSVSHRDFLCFPVCVAFRIGFCSAFAISRLSAHASFDLRLSSKSVQGFGGGRGGDDVHATVTCVFFSFGDLLLLGCFPVCVCVSHFASVFAVFCHLSTVCTCQLRLAFVFELCAVWGGWGGGDDIHETATCVFFFFW